MTFSKSASVTSEDFKTMSSVILEKHVGFWTLDIGSIENPFLGDQEEFPGGKRISHITFLI
jgi:hypothetical protein